MVLNFSMCIFFYPCSSIVLTVAIAVYPLWHLYRVSETSLLEFSKRKKSHGNNQIMIVIIASKHYAAGIKTISLKQFLSTHNIPCDRLWADQENSFNNNSFLVIFVSPNAIQTSFLWEGGSVPVFL